MEGKITLTSQVALSRLVARYPSLTQDSIIQPLLSKGSDLKEGDILAVSHELLLRPNLTVAVAGCFRHLLSQMVSSLVESMRELYFPDENPIKKRQLLEAEPSTMCWNLTIHEYVIMAFSRILELAPYLLSTILQYFSFAPPPFERLLRGDFSKTCPDENDVPLLDIVRASYRFVQLEPTTFQGLWDWSPFLDLLQWEDTRSEDGLMLHSTFDVRWCAVQILSLVLSMSDEATRAFSFKMSGLTEEMAFTCLIRWEEFCQEIAVEKAGWYVETGSFQNEHVPDPDSCPATGDTELNCTVERESHAKWRTQAPTMISHLKICGIQIIVRKNAMSTNCAVPSSGKSLILTPTARKNLEAVVLALSQKQPILLVGPLGVGKTSLIQELAQVTGNSDVIFIHLDDQMDSKTLLGSYVCTEVPGEFKWQPGALTQAVVRGLWVVFENIDRAPSEVRSALVPLLEDRKLYIPGRAEMLFAAENFQLFATVTTSKFTSENSLSGRKITNNLWLKLVIDSLGDNELATIVKRSFPLLTSVISKLIGTLNMVNGIASHALSNINNANDATVFVGREFSLRDILKWCKRIMASGLSSIGGPVLSASIRELIFVEAVDCFSGSIASSENRHLVMRSIAKLWDVPDQHVDFLENLNKPSFQILPNAVQVGRAILPIEKKKENSAVAQRFASTGYAMRILERIAVCVRQQEPVLLVGETGTGKTTLVQHLAHQLCTPLIVMNLSQQSDSTDFLGGFKPIEAQSACLPLLGNFIELFCQTFPSQQNTEFLVRIQQFAEKKKWDQLLKAFRLAVAKVEKLNGSSISLPGAGSGPPSGRENVQAVRKSEMIERVKRKRPLSKGLLDSWHSFSQELSKCNRQVEAAKNAFAFSFVEGALVRALRHGHWILLDEVNLAPPETLERLTGLLDGEGGSLYLTERGDIEHVTRHPNFRVFACMNPATDVGKRDLPFLLKNRFTQFFIDEMTNKEDLHSFVYRYLEDVMPSPPVEEIVSFYLKARQEAETRLFDGANQKPQYSLRSLSRALEYTRAAVPIYGFQRALYDGISMTFLTLLDRPSAAVMENLITSCLLNHLSATSKATCSFFRVPAQPSPDYVLFEQFWVESGGWTVAKSSMEFCKQYVLTKSIKEHLKNLARAVFIRRYPVLLQGPTSSGKTSLVEYLAIITGHRFVRINNHEHTDLQEYLGTYVTDCSGKLVFQEGILVEAVRNGYWIVLDELNLAPSDVLEALNRLLDDNRELFVPEIQMKVKPHPHFMLFATQNPPGIYGGRKVLSRAFRNRFLELHIDDIPEDEICSILEKRCEIPGSYAQKMVAVMKDLQRHRQSSKVFAGKHGFITPRDLFRWADRHRRAGISYEDLAKDGYMLLAERLRNVNERAIVLEVLERNLHVKIDVETLYEVSTTSQMEELQKHLASPLALALFGKIVWTKSMRRLFSLVQRCYENSEPVLLVGETGCGKTTVCQVLALVHKQYIHVLNCHQHTETSDFLGGFRPIRERERIALQFGDAVKKLNSSELFRKFHKAELLSSIENARTILCELRKVLDAIKDHISFLDSGSLIEHKEVNSESKKEVACMDLIQQELLQLQKDWQSLFLWQDGPLVKALRKGDLFLVDEISLADDSVLERLNSVLEPKRLLVLAERGGSDVEELIAHPKFLLLATMNPGGDFGKKELSPALRNRFTEIWVPPVMDLEDLRSIMIDRLSRPELSCLVDPLLSFWKWFQLRETGRCLTVRDLLSWITFINTVEEKIGIYAAYIHGAFLIVLDGISAGIGISTEAGKELKQICIEFLLQQIPQDKRDEWNDSQDCHIMSNEVSSSSKEEFGIHPFFILKGLKQLERSHFELTAPTTSSNTYRILRAMQLSKPVLLEGSPGVGKTSLVAALANASGHSLVRINLSEQTDIMDLLGSDLPVEGGKGAEFRWSDGVFLQALKAGSWVLLDELNLASQSVLEGLNACLDHRGEIYIPELGFSFKCLPTFRIFACQNPSCQGGGRKGLPKSFLNRFTKVYVETLTEDDFLFISSTLYPSIPKQFLQKLIRFNTRMYKDTMVAHSFGHSGSPWEFNLRDILRSCNLIEGFRNNEQFDVIRTQTFLDVVYIQRMRTVEDRIQVLRLYKEVFGVPAAIDAFPRISISPQHLKVGRASLQRISGSHSSDFNEHLQLLPGQAKCLESIMNCVQHGWMCILVGPPASGKTSLVRLLSKLTGNQLHEFTLSSGTDTTELLGCFEQRNLFRSWQNLIKRAHHALKVVCGLYLSFACGILSQNKSITVVRTLLVAWSSFQRCLNEQQDVAAWTLMGSEQNLETIVPDPFTVDLLSKLLNEMEQLVSVFETPNLHLSSELGSLQRELIALKENINNKANAGHFEWVASGLLNALECGDWVVLENANLCNPTVLDRLNPLLESNGTIMVNERGLVNGESMVVKAHSNFRLFLSVDPIQGEISRAMRNRGVEVFVMQPDWLITEANSLSPLPSQLDEIFQGTQDASRFLVVSGLPGTALIEAMCRAHTEMKVLSETSWYGHHISFRELSQWIQLLQQLIGRGTDLITSLQSSWEQIYTRSLENIEERDAALCIFRSHLASLRIVVNHNWKKPTFQLAGGWPCPLTLDKFSRMSTEAVVKRDCMYVEHLAVQHFAVRMLCESHPFEGENCFAWLQRKKELAALFPAHFLCCLLHPSPEMQVEVHTYSLLRSKMTVLDRKVVFAGFWMMEQENMHDGKMRLLWIQNFSARLGGGCDSLKLLACVVERELSHPLRKRLMSTWEELKLLETDPCVIKMQPLSSLLVAGSKDEPDVCRCFHFLGKKIVALRQSLMQWQLEDEVFAKVEQTSFSRMEPYVLRSYRYHSCQPFEDNSVAVLSDLRSCVFPLLCALRKIEEEFLTSSSLPVWNDHMGKLFSRLQDWHKAFWDVVYQPDFEWALLMFCWNKLKKGVNLLIQCITKPEDKTLQVINKFQHLCQCMDLALCQEGGISKPYLWKYGGRPHLPHSKKLYEMQQSVLKLCHAFWPVSVQGGEPKVGLVTDCSVCHLVLEGVSMVACIIQGTIEATTSSLGYEAAISKAYYEIEEIYTMLVTLLETEELRIREQRDCLWFKLLPWLDLISLYKDAVGLTEVMPVATQFVAVKSASKLLMLQLQGSKKILQDVMDFSLKFSSRSPLDFTPHQHLLWVLEMRNCEDGTRCQIGTRATNFQTYVNQIWFNWHSAIWKSHPECCVESLSYIWKATVGPPRLFQASQSILLSNMILQTVTVKEYDRKISQLRLVSRILWGSEEGIIHGGLQSDFVRASAVFQQFLFIHAKSFPREALKEMQLLLSYLHRRALQEGFQGSCGQEFQELQALKVLIVRSNHLDLVALCDLFILPCAKLLYYSRSTAADATDLLSVHGKIWIFLGSIRLRLMIPSNGKDPVVKYNYDHGHLTQKLADLRTELEVRQESDILVGGGVNIGETKEFMSRIEELEQNLAVISAKLIYRPDPSGVQMLLKDATAFIESLANFQKISGFIDALQRPLKNADEDLIIQEVTGWQENAMHFIQRLSVDYSSYQDIAQPIQLGIYELKFGLSLMLTAWLQKVFFSGGGPKISGENLDEMLCTLVEFPRKSQLGYFSSGTTISQRLQNAEESIFSTALAAAEMLDEMCNHNFLKVTGKLVAGSSQREILVFRLKMMITQITLARIRKHAMQTRVLSRDLLEYLNATFNSVTTLRAEVREHASARKQEKVELIRFKHRSHRLDIDMEEDEDSFRRMFPEFLRSFGVVNDSSTVSADDTNFDNEAANNSPVDVEGMEFAWSSIEDSLAKDVVRTQSQIFGINGTLQFTENPLMLSDDDRLDAFVLSYDAGRILFEGVGHSLPAKVDENLVPAHLLRLCLEYNNLFFGSEKLSQSLHFNIYKDPYASEMALMLEPLAYLRERLDGLLKEWPEQPILQQLFEIIKSLLAISLEAPLMKGLIGVQHLLAKAQLWEENAPKHLSLSGELGRLSRLVTKWRKFELECWPNLLANVELQHEMSAEKLWFPLYGVLHRSAVDYENLEFEGTTASLEEFLQTSTLGEFRKRLDILLGFHRQFYIQCRVQTAGPSRDMLERISNILYNIFHYYSQFLPLVHDSIVAGKVAIESELKEFTQLCKWDDRSYYSLISSSEKTHRKVHKLVCKYDELLKKPVVEVLNQQAQRMGVHKIASSCELQERNADSKVSPMVKLKQENDFREQELGNGDRHVPKVESSNNHWHQFFESRVKGLSGLIFHTLDFAGPYHKRLPSLLPRIGCLLGENVFSQTACQVRQKGRDHLENFGNIVIMRAAELQKGDKKRVVKRKALVDLLKALRDMGLSHHRSAVPKEERNAKTWFQQPPSEVSDMLEFWIERLLKQDASSFYGVHEVQEILMRWKRSKDYFFKNVALVQHLRQSSLSFNKDLSLREVSISTAYMEHLLYLQRSQRRVAHSFAVKLGNLQNVIVLLGCFGEVDDYTILLQQELIRKWMWYQKDLLDSVCSTSYEASLFFKMVKGVQICSRESDECNAENLKAELDKINIMLLQCKNDLDNQLIPGMELFSQISVETTWPIVITPQMLNIVVNNFRVLTDVKFLVDEVHEQKSYPATKKVLGLSSLHDLLCKALIMSEDFEQESISNSSKRHENPGGYESFVEHYNRVISEILIAIQALNRMGNISDSLTLSNGNECDSVSDIYSVDEAVSFNEKIQTWVTEIEEQMSALKLEQIFAAVLNAVSLGVEFSDCQGGVGGQSLSKAGMLLGCLKGILEFVHAAGACILFDYINLHKTVAKVCYILSNLFSSLFHDGFCVSKEEVEEGEPSDFKDASGTGMGEGEGKKDVSNQIEDEEQLLGSSQNANREDHDSHKKPENGDKGIEMEQNFEGDMFDVSQDESDEVDEADEDIQLDSKMGDTGENEEVIDEKLWSNDDDEKAQDGTERYESGAPVKDGDAELELRAKEKEAEDGTDQISDDIGKEGIAGQEPVSPKEPQHETDQAENIEEDMLLKKNDAYEAPSGINPSTEDIDLPENMELDHEGDEADPSADDKGGAKDIESFPESMEDEDDIDSLSAGSNDRTVGNEEGAAEDAIMGDTENNVLEIPNEPSADQNAELRNPNYLQCPVEKPPAIEAQEMEETTIIDPKSSCHSMNFEGACAVSSTATDPFCAIEKGDTQGRLSSMPDVLDKGNEMVLSSANTGMVETWASEPASTSQDSQKVETVGPNPYRSLGDALRDWKERVKVSDTAFPNLETENRTMEVHGSELEEAEEYEFVRDGEKSNAQALAAATCEQLGETRDVNHIQMQKDEIDEEQHILDFSEMQREEESKKTVVKPTQLHKITKHRSIDQAGAPSIADYIQGDENDDFEGVDADHLQDRAQRQDTTLSIIRVDQTKTLASDYNEAPRRNLWTEEELHSIRSDLEMKLKEGTHSIAKARVLWTKYEQLTNPLSQELSEQLRLIMEPTLATRLEGDYRSGKRINMKKVIPYIASQFRKDKIWLRRTKPSKRQYQVVIAIDDSRSMSESHCGHMALEALFTICRAMATLEVGQMAVASFGEKGNVRLLHDFDQPFSSEVGIHMVSQFSFKQDNTIADEPMVDLLHYLTRMLDMVASRALIPSGQNNLQQLVLIIADGRFHEKETLRRCIREALRRRQLLAFIVLDNPHESIMDVQSVSFSNGAPIFSKYLDTFPFPYYILLKDIEALPRTLADLLRQWFEVMQQTPMY